MRAYRNVAAVIMLLSVLAGCVGCSGMKPGGAGEEKAEKSGIQETAESGKSMEEYEGEAEREEETAETVTRERDDSKYRMDFRETDRVNERDLDFCEEYAALVEGSMEEWTFERITGGGDEELEEMLLGHYEVAGRSGGEGRVYYLAVRREDAPAYGDFGELSVGYLDDVCQIGYNRGKKGNFEERLLYQVPGWSVIITDESWSEDSLNVLCFLPFGEKEPAFLASFSRGGRRELEFMKKHEGLSFHEEGGVCINFLYQDRDTIEFWSEPYRCCIRLSEEDAEELRTLLEKEDSGEEQIRLFERYGDALDYVRTVDSSIRTTGAGFSLDGRGYQLLGSRGQEGYLLSWQDTEAGGEELRLEKRVEAWQYVRDKISASVDRDYGDFTDTWFDVPLTSASLEFLRIKTEEDGKSRFETCVQVVEEQEKLKELSRIMGSAVRGHEVLGKCPYQGVLEMVREDGETLQMFVAVDSCDSVTYEGRIGFEYGRQEELAAIFDEAMGDR